MTKEKKKKLHKGILITCSVLAGLALLVLTFFGGYYLRGIIGSTSYDWVLELIRTYYYEDVDLDDVMELTIDTIVETYLDEYSQYYTAEEYKASLLSNSGRSSGIGITYSFVEDEGAYITYAIPNSPAYISGIRSGDIVESGVVDGKEAEFTTASDFTSFMSSVSLGDEVTFVTTENKTCNFVYADYTISYINFATKDGGWYFTGDDALELSEMIESDAIEYLGDGVGYISLYRFYGDAASQMQMAVKQLNEEGCDTIILDLRNNGGGLVSVMRDIAGCFESCAGQEVMTAVYKDATESTVTASSYSSEYTLGSDVSVYVLANGKSASASEALIGALVSYGVVEYENICISEYSEGYLKASGLTADEAKSGRTYGKGIMQSTYVNAFTGEALKLTTAQLYWPNGETIHGTGLSAVNGCTIIKAPLPASGVGDELYNAVLTLF